jgi:hypothetical protein
MEDISKASDSWLDKSEDAVKVAKRIFCVKLVKSKKSGLGPTNN